MNQESCSVGKSTCGQTSIEKPLREEHFEIDNYTLWLLWAAGCIKATSKADRLSGCPISQRGKGKKHL